MNIIISPEKQGRMTSSLPIYICFISFSCLISSEKIPSIRFNMFNESEQNYLISELEENSAFLNSV
jgi:hypothetical protein